MKTSVVAPNAAPPDAPTGVASVAAGPLTGTAAYLMSGIYAGRGETEASTAGAGVVLSAKSADLTLALAPETAATGVCLGRRIYRTFDAGTTIREVATVWDNSTTTHTDSVPQGSEGIRVPRVGTTGLGAEQTGANYGLKFLRPDTGTDFSRNDSPFKSTEQTGRLGAARSIPGLVAYPHAFNFDLRSGTLVPLFASMLGKPTVSQEAGTPVLTYSFPLSDLSSDSVSLWASWYKGGDFRPQTFGGIKCGEIDLNFSGKAGGKAKAKLMGQWDTEAGLAAKVSGSGTYESIPVVRGVRSDANRATYSVFLKVIATPAIASGVGSFTVRAALAAAGGTPTFGTAATATVYFDPATSRQAHPAAFGSSLATANQSAWIELFESTTSLALGYDSGENRKPFEVYFPGDVTALLANDIYEIPALAKVPGIYSAAHPTGPADDGSFTGQAPRMTLSPRFGPAHVSLRKGASSGTTSVLNFQAGGIKISRPLDAVEGLGPEAANPLDVDVFGKLTLEVDVERRLESREFERLMKEDGRLYAVLALTGERITVDPVAGTISTKRDLVEMTLGQVAVDKTDSPLSGDKVYVEKVKILAEQPDDDALDAFALKIQSPDSWDFARI